MKKLLIVPILIFVYIFLIQVLSQMSFQEAPSQSLKGGGSLEIVNIGQSIGVSVTRPYLFGLTHLPVYTESLGDIGGYHNAFFAFIVILTIALIVLEFRNRKEIKGRKTYSYKRR